jgi:hypothetical protein
MIEGDSQPWFHPFILRLLLSFVIANVKLSIGCVLQTVIQMYALPSRGRLSDPKAHTWS